MKHRCTTLPAILLMCSLLLAPMSSARAQGQGTQARSFPVQRTHPAPAAAGEKLTNLLADPSLEASYNSPSPAWEQSSTNSGTPLCTVAACGNGGGTAGPRSGSVWARFGGVNFSQPGTVSPEIGSIYQDVHFRFAPPYSNSISGLGRLPRAAMRMIISQCGSTGILCFRQMRPRKAPIPPTGWSA